MCGDCRRGGFGLDIYDMYDIFGGGRYGGFGGYDGDGVNRSGFQAVSDRARNAQDTARRIFLEHLARVDTTAGPVTSEIIQFHLVPDMKKQFTKFVKDHGCTATSRKLTREEQDKVNKTRKSLMQYTSVKVTPEAQRAYLAAHPEVAARVQQEHANNKENANPAREPLKTKKRNANEAELDHAPAQAGPSKPVKQVKV